MRDGEVELDVMGDVCRRDDEDAGDAAAAAGEETRACPVLVTRLFSGQAADDLVDPATELREEPREPAADEPDGPAAALEDASGTTIPPPSDP